MIYKISCSLCSFAKINLHPISLQMNDERERPTTSAWRSPVFPSCCLPAWTVLAFMRAQSIPAGSMKIVAPFGVRWSSSSEGVVVPPTLIPSTWLPPTFVFKILTKWLLGRPYALVPNLWEAPRPHTNEVLPAGQEESPSLASSSNFFLSSSNHTMNLFLFFLSFMCHRSH
jgi:hypothetical protein